MTIKLRCLTPALDGECSSDARVELHAHTTVDFEDAAAQPQKHLDAGRCVRRNASFAACLPTVLLIGVQKGGTTAFQRFAAQHAALAVHGQEGQFFNRLEHADDVFVRWWPYLLGIRADDRGALRRSCGEGGERYTNCGLPEMRGRGQWPVQPGGGSVGFDKTPDYLPRGLDAIRALLPSARLIVLLREPGARAFSAFKYTGLGLRARLGATKGMYARLLRVACRSSNLTLPSDVGPSSREGQAAIPDWECPPDGLPCARSPIAGWSSPVLFDYLVRIGAMLSRGARRGSLPPNFDRRHRSHPLWCILDYSRYGRQLRQLLALGFAHVTLALSEAFFAQPQAMADAVWRWLGLPRAAARGRGAAPAWQGRASGYDARGMPLAAVAAHEGAANVSRLRMLPRTRAALDVLFDEDVREVERLVPGLGLERWWGSFSKTTGNGSGIW